jgi:glycine cleavage system regulatory protein
MSGEVLFEAKADLRIPHDVSLDELRETLETIATELMVDLTLDDPE